uniref:E3 UFM1-protein ligase 1 homolog n=1 Tax=Globodera rostochiensis TaxID=31243 RepID=A0A914GWZ0_GLORO
MTTSTTWADIQRLAADLQRVQLAEGSKRLSEANCVEVVTMLMSMGLVQLVITTDGKEYVTRKHLVTECANECLAAGGRISLTELASQLNVDLDHVQTAINQLLNQHRTDDGISAAAEFVVCAGELVHREFINDLCVRINSRLEEHGQMSLLQLTKQWELSTEMLNFHILPEIGDRPPARICAVRFEENLCTPRYIAALRKKINAILVAITK